MDKIIIDQGRANMYGFIEPQAIQNSENAVGNFKDIYKHRIMSHKEKLSPRVYMSRLLYN